MASSALTFSMGNLGLIKPKNNSFTTTLPGGQGYSEGAENGALPLNPFSQMPNTPQQNATSGVSDAAVQQAAQARLKEFSFNPKYAQQDQDFQRRATNAKQMLDATLADTDATYKEQTQDATDVRTKAMQKLAERLASQGIYNSGIRVQEEGNVSEDFQRYLGDLEKRRVSGRNAALMGYSGQLDEINSTRERMYMQQVQEEEQMRLEQERQQAAAIAAQQEAERQNALMQALIQAQQEAAARMSPPSAGFSGGGSIGAPTIPGFSGGGPAPAPAAPSIFALPAGYFQTPGASRQNAEQYVTTNIDRNLSGAPLGAVVDALSKNPGGLTLDAITQIINNARIQEGAKQRIGRPF